MLRAGPGSPPERQPSFLHRFQPRAIATGGRASSISPRYIATGDPSRGGERHTLRAGIAWEDWRGEGPAAEAGNPPYPPRPTGAAEAASWQGYVTTPEGGSLRYAAAVRPSRRRPSPGSAGLGGLGGGSGVAFGAGAGNGNGAGGGASSGAIMWETPLFASR